MGFVLVMGMLIVAISFIPVLAKTSGIVVAWIVTFFNRIIYWLQGLNPQSFHFLRLTGIELALLYVCIGGIMVFMLKKSKPALFSSFGALSLFLLLLCSDEWAALHQRKLVAYNINKINHIELIEGKYYTVLNTDTVVAANKKDYILKPAHIYWRAWKNKGILSNEIFLIGHKRVLLLNQFNINCGNFPVDYLLINCPAKQIDLRQLQAVFSPKTIILGNNYPRRLIDNCYEKCKENNIPLHTLMYDGAFVTEAF